MKETFSIHPFSKYICEYICVLLLVLNFSNIAFAEDGYPKLTDEQYASVLNHNRQVKKEWSEMKYEWMRPENFLQLRSPELSGLSDEIVRGISSDYGKARAIHDYICDNLYYDYEALEMGFGLTVTHNAEESAHYESLNAYERLMEYKRGVCGYYSSIYSELLRAQNIPCKVVRGYAGNNIEAILAGDRKNHAWNEVYIDGRWMNVDTAYDSLNKYSLEGEYIYKGYRDDYFDISDEEFSKNHRIYEYEDVKKYAISKRVGAAGGTLDVEPGTAYEGQMVTITANPETGYSLKGIKLIKWSLTEEIPVPYTRQGDNSFTFIMPAHDVMLSASFAAA